MSKASGTKVIFMPFSSEANVSGPSTGGNIGHNYKIDPTTASVYQQISEQH